MTTIKHNEYDAAGNIIGNFEVSVPPSNETDTDIFITDKYLRDRARETQPGTSSKSNYTGYEKAVWYKPDQGEPVRIKSMECKRSQEDYEIVFTRMDDKKITKIIAV